MKCGYSCGTAEHALGRRAFLRGTFAGAGAMAGFSSLTAPAVSAQLGANRKQVLLIWLAGGVSQLETWDPKPGTDTGGPFRPIATSVPGTQICELLPHTAKQMHRLSIVRSININENDHGKGAVFMQTGWRQTPGQAHPHLGSVSAKLLEPSSPSLPGFIHVSPKGNGVNRQDAAFLGPQYGSLSVGGTEPIANSALPGGVTAETEAQRQAYRRQFSDRFASRRRTAETDVYSSSFEQARQLMEQKDLFDISKAPEKDQERYGKHDFGRHCLLANRLLEAGVTFVKVTHTNYDTHHENFNFHLEQLGEFDRPFATLVDDLAQSGRLANTLVIVMSEFGRTPTINQRYGRDHWGTAWSIALGGAGVQPGAVIGKTNDNGTAVADRQVHAGHLFHTYLQAVGVDSLKQVELGGRPIQIADPTSEPIKELLS